MCARDEQNKQTFTRQFPSLLQWGGAGGRGCEVPCEQTEAFVSLHGDSFDSFRFRELGGMSQFTLKGKNASTAVATRAYCCLTRRSYTREQNNGSLPR